MIDISNNRLIIVLRCLHDPKLKRYQENDKMNPSIFLIPKKIKNEKDIKLL